MRNLYLLAVSVTLSFALTACDTIEIDPINERSAQLLVGNQGNFSAGDGSVSSINLETWEATTPIRDLESIVQSMFAYAGRLHVLSNTGQRVDVFDAHSLQRVHTTSGLLSPRYAAEYFNRIFVSNLFADASAYAGGYVTVLDVQTYNRIAAIPVGDHPEGVADQAERIFVANHGFGDGHTISMIDPIQLEVEQTIDAECDGPRFLLAGRGDDLYVTCTGTTLFDDDWQVIGQSNGAIRIINAREGTVIRRHEVDGQVRASDFGQDAYYDRVNNRLYAIINTNVVKIFDGETLNEVGTLGPFDGDPIGAVAYDAEIDRLYLARVSGFSTQGAVTVHRPDGSLERSIAVGVAPTSLLIRR